MVIDWRWGQRLQLHPTGAAAVSHPFFLASILSVGLAIRKSLVPLARRGVLLIGRVLAGFSRFQEAAVRALRLSLVCMVLSWADPCLGGGWPTSSAAGPVVCQDGKCCPSPQRSAGVGVGLSVGGWRTVTPPVSRPTAPVVRASPVVPVLFGSDPVPAAGVYVGVIGGHGVTLTCWHAAKYGVRSVASEQPTDITRDKYGYDMVAVFTRPLNILVARLGQSPRPGDVVTIVGFPGGRYGSHAGRVAGYYDAESGQSWGDLAVDVASEFGDSGGGVFDRGGQLVGLLWGDRIDGQAGSVAVSAPAIADFLERLWLRCETPLVPVPETWEGLVPAPPPPESPDTDLVAIRAELAALRELIAAIPAGVDGQDGHDGQDGADGSDGVSPTIDYAAVAAAVAPLLPPLKFQPVHMDGTPAGAARLKWLGDTVEERPLTFQGVNSKGEPADEAIPKWHGDTVELETYLVEKPL